MPARNAIYQGFSEARYEWGTWRYWILIQPASETPFDFPQLQLRVLPSDALLDKIEGEAGWEKTPFGRYKNGKLVMNFDTRYLPSDPGSAEGDLREWILGDSEGALRYNDDKVVSVVVALMSDRGDASLVLEDFSVEFLGMHIREAGSVTTYSGESPEVEIELQDVGKGIMESISAESISLYIQSQVARTLGFYGAHQNGIKGDDFLFGWRLFDTEILYDFVYRANDQDSTTWRTILTRHIPADVVFGKADVGYTYFDRMYTERAILLPINRIFSTIEARVAEVATALFRYGTSQATSVASTPWPHATTALWRQLHYISDIKGPGAELLPHEKLFVALIVDYDLDSLDRRAPVGFAIPTSYQVVGGLCDTRQDGANFSKHENVWDLLGALAETFGTRMIARWSLRRVTTPRAYGAFDMLFEYTRLWPNFSDQSAVLHIRDSDFAEGWEWETQSNDIRSAETPLDTLSEKDAIRRGYTTSHRSLNDADLSFASVFHTYPTRGDHGDLYIDPNNTRGYIHYPAPLGGTDVSWRTPPGAPQIRYTPIHWSLFPQNIIKTEAGFDVRKIYYLDIDPIITVTDYEIDVSGEGGAVVRITRSGLPGIVPMKVWDGARIATNYSSLLDIAPYPLLPASVMHLGTTLAGAGSPSAEFPLPPVYRGFDDKRDFGAYDTYFWSPFRWIIDWIQQRSGLAQVVTESVVRNFSRYRNWPVDIFITEPLPAQAPGTAVLHASVPLEVATMRDIGRPVELTFGVLASPLLSTGAKYGIMWSADQGFGVPRTSGILLEAKPNFSTGYTDITVFIVNDSFAGKYPHP